LWRCGDGLFFEIPPLASDAILQRSTHFSKTCCRPFAAVFRRIVEQVVLSPRTFQTALIVARIKGKRFPLAKSWSLREVCMLLTTISLQQTLYILCTSLVTNDITRSQNDGVRRRSRDVEGESARQINLETMQEMKIESPDDIAPSYVFCTQPALTRLPCCQSVSNHPAGRNTYMCRTSLKRLQDSKHLTVMDLCSLLRKGKVDQITVLSVFCC
jgi:hypothetical protein